MTQVSSLYLHVPFCKHLCNYCDFYKKKLENEESQFDNFHQFLLASLPTHSSLLGKTGFNWSTLDTVYLGGGTPSLWGSKGAGFLSDLLRPIGIKKNAEFTMEIDPGTWTPEMIESWQSIGLNRISVGTQSLNPEFLKILDRAHSIEESLNFLNFLRQENWNFSLDFLLGVPFSREKKRDIKSELDTLLSYSPKHISLYILNARSKYPHTQHMPDDEFIREEYLLVSDYLMSLGFHHYEVSNFALPGYESRHNMKYWLGESVAALGPTGTGYLAVSKDEAMRYKWKVSTAQVEIENLGKAELSLERIYLSLRTSLGWKPDELTPKLQNIFSIWKDQDYGQFNGERMILNQLGFLMLDSLMDDLFRAGYC